MQDQKPRDLESDLRTTVNLIYLIAASHSMCIIPFIRHSLGTQMPGFLGLGAMMTMVAGILILESPAILTFGKVWFVVLLLQRCWTGYLYLRGYRGHSMYDGWCWFARLFPKVQTEGMARNVEPGLCLLIGLMIAPISPAVCIFVGSCSISMTIQRVISLVIADRQVAKARDAMLEQQWLARRLRE